jgi:hypothetical protein
MYRDYGRNVDQNLRHGLDVSCTWKRKPETSHFFKLPLELRRQIYTLFAEHPCDQDPCCEQDYTIYLDRRTNKLDVQIAWIMRGTAHREQPLRRLIIRLLLVCHEFHDEINGAFYRHASFTSFYALTTRFLNEIGPRNTANIKFLEIQLRSGPEYYSNFTDTLRLLESSGSNLTELRISIPETRHFVNNHLRRLCHELLRYLSEFECTEYLELSTAGWIDLQEKDVLMIESGSTNWIRLR